MIEDSDFQIIIVGDVNVNVVGAKVNVVSANVNVVGAKVTIDIAKVNVAGAKVTIDIAKVNVGNIKVTGGFGNVSIEFGTFNVEKNSFYDINRIFLCFHLFIIIRQNSHRTFIR